MMVEAYNLRLTDQIELLRHQTYLLMLPNLKKGTTKKQFNKDCWPIDGEEKKGISKDLEERYNRLKNGNKRT